MSLKIKLNNITMKEDLKSYKVILTITYSANGKYKEISKEIDLKKYIIDKELPYPNILMKSKSGM